MSNIGSRTSRTLVLLLLLLPVLGYYNASNIVVEESMMQVSFGFTTEIYRYFLWYARYWSVFIQARLGKDCTYTLIARITIQYHWSFQVGIGQQAYGCQLLFQTIKYPLTVLGPLKPRILPSYCYKWARQPRKGGYEPPIITCSSSKSSYLSYHREMVHSSHNRHLINIRLDPFFYLLQTPGTWSPPS